MIIPLSNVEPETGFYTLTSIHALASPPRLKAIFIVTFHRLAATEPENRLAGEPVE